MFFVFLLASVGMTHIIVDGSIFANIRGFITEKGPNWLKQFISCYQCTGFWCGVVMGLLINPTELFFVINAFVCGCATSYSAMAAAALLNYLDRPWNTNQ